jgi:hypothetical protein
MPNAAPPPPFSSLPHFFLPQELSILDYKMLQFDFSTAAAASLVAAHQLTGAPFEDQAQKDLLHLAPFLRTSDVLSCANALWASHLALAASSLPGYPGCAGNS